MPMHHAHAPCPCTMPMHHAHAQVRFDDSRLTTRTSGASSAEECVCEIDYFSVHTTGDGLRCVRCPNGANCTSVGLSLTTLPLEAGAWRYSNTSRRVSTCRAPSACPGGAFLQPWDAAHAMAPCATGHRGVLCDSCDPGFFRGPAEVCPRAHVLMRSCPCAHAHTRVRAHERVRMSACACARTCACA